MIFHVKFYEIYPINLVQKLQKCEIGAGQLKQNLLATSVLYPAAFFKVGNLFSVIYMGTEFQCQILGKLPNQSCLNAPHI